MANVIGKVGDGFKMIMKNFNHERWGLGVQALRFARVCLEEAMVHAQRRETFGKKLMEHPVRACVRACVCASSVRRV